ncbi:MAG: hypothetical protein B7Y90_15185 [Alphaproteobacteria bacterium 32-64-14]|nr:MAG: hypothetical protein B7Y90_15185 [Alphaproteobacteria bacterium 32-64-14]
MSLTPEQLERYARHIMLREIGGPGQQKLLKAHVALVGLGALGGPAALYLAASGVGKLTLIDDDSVSLSNLQRQILFDTDDVGQPKTDVGARRLAAVNPGLNVETRAARLSPDNAADLLAGADIVVDYRCLVSEMPETEETCAMVGVIGPLTGIIGARLALEAVKEITSAGQSLAGRLWLFDGLNGEARTVTLKADPACSVCGD